MRLLPLIFALLPALSWAQAAPSPATGDARVRYAVGQTIRETIRTNYPAANDNAIDKTIQRVGQVMGDAANNPEYQANATRWAWIGFRLIQRANPYISIALELCAWQGLCTPNKKLDVIQVNDNDTIITQYHYDLPYPTMVPGFAYYAKKVVPLSDFVCKYGMSYYQSGEYFFPPQGDPCLVKAGIPSEILLHKQYLQTYRDWFEYDPATYNYISYPTIAQVQQPMMICDAIGVGSGTRLQKIQNPYWPCISIGDDNKTTRQYYTTKDYNAVPFFPFVFTSTGQRIRIVTDFVITSLSNYPDAPPKGRIDLYPWLQSLTATDLVPAVSPEWIQQVATAAWRQAMQNPSFDGLPIPDDGISPLDLENALNLLGDEWPTIGDMVDPIENNQVEPYYLKNNRPNRVYRFNWTCGFSNMPKCMIDFIVGATSSGLDLVGIPYTPFDPFTVDSFAPPNNFSSFLNSRFSGGSCIQNPASAHVTGQVRVINWDFCKFANVARDVLALLAYITTAGVLVGGLRTARQDRK